jgi:hypothetical protein
MQVKWLNDMVELPPYETTQPAMQIVSLTLEKIFIIGQIPYLINMIEASQAILLKK